MKIAVLGGGFSGLYAADRLAGRAQVEVFEAAEASTANARRVAEHLVEANLKGHDSHGVGMIPAYVNNIVTGNGTTVWRDVPPGGLVLNRKEQQHQPGWKRPTKTREGS